MKKKITEKKNKTTVLKHNLHHDFVYIKLSNKGVKMI